MRETHPAEPVLRAYLDGELEWSRATACALHLRRCPRCQDALAEVRELEHRAAWLLSRAGAAVSAAPAPTRPRWSGWSLGLGAVAAVVLLLLAGPSVRRGSPDASGSGTRDVCCWDLDGGGRGDDGVFTRSRDGQIVDCAIVYDDVDNSRSLTPADVVRIAPAGDGCAAGDRGTAPAGQPPSG